MKIIITGSLGNISKPLAQELMICQSINVDIPSLIFELTKKEPIPKGWLFSKIKISKITASQTPHSPAIQRLRSPRPKASHQRQNLYV